VIDPDNPVVKLCAEGIAAEGRHDYAAARALYTQAWELRSSDYEACIAAHYLARQQATLADSRHWNQLALDHALAAPAEQIAGFLPSLYLNLGWSHEVLGDAAAARACYAEGAARLDALLPGSYTDVVRDGITRGLERTQGG
jgi:hypothetical protein